MDRAWRVVPPLVGVLVAIALLVASRGLDEVARAGELGPGFWPRLVLVGLALSCAAKALVEWRRRPRAAPGETAASEAPAPMSGRRLSLALAAIVLYVLLTPWVGFPAATAAFVLAFMALCGARSLVAPAASAVVGTVFLVYLFVKIVYLPLPKGTGVFETVTLGLYRALGVF
jgi:hypothetical protein